MSSFLRFLLFVPPTLFLFFPAFSQVQGKLEQIPSSSTFQVSIVSNVNLAPPQSDITSGQITIRATAGELDVTNFQSQNGLWEMDTPLYSPVEAPGFDYFSFYLATPVTNLALVAGDEVPLFTFENALICTYLELIDNDSDPFLPPNSANSNIGHTFTITGATMVEAYEGNTAQLSADCPPLGLTFLLPSNPVPCHGDATAVTVQAVMGTPPYTVTWENPATGASGNAQITEYEGTVSFPDWPAGNYLLSITDLVGGYEEVPVQILQPAALEIELTGDDASCNGSMDGQAFVSDVDGGTAATDYQYFWDTNPLVSSQSIGFLNPGTYTVSVVDDNGCTATDSVEIGSFSIILLNSQIRDISCFGLSNGVIDLYPVSLNGPYSFDWSPNVTTGDYSSAWMLGAGTYSVTVTDNSGMCTETGTYSIEEPAEIEMDYRMVEPHCFGDAGYVEVIGVSNAVGPWSASIIGEASEITPNTFEVEPGFPLRLVVTDRNDCMVSDDFLIPSKQEILVDIGENRAIKFGETINFETEYYPKQNVTLQWSPSEGLSCDDCPNPSVTPLESITYRLQVIDTAGCVGEDMVAIGVTKSRDIYIPNAFSPNQDGINDMFCPFAGFGVVAIHSMQVFDRWGGLVFSQNKRIDPQLQPKTGWDGNSHGKPAELGTYLYTMNIEFIDGETILYSGEVNLMR